MVLVLTALGVACAVLLLSSALRFLQHLLQVARMLYLTRGVPGPTAYPLIGVLPTFLAVWSDMHGMLLQLRSRYGNTVRMPLFDRVVLMVMDPDDVQVVCTHPSLAGKPPHYDMLRHHLGMGLVNMNGPSYRRHRKAITPSLHLDILQDFVPVFAKNAEAMARRLLPYADSGAVVDVAPEFGLVANMTVTETVLSSQLAGNAKELAAIVEALKNASDLVMWRSLRPWWENDWVFRLSSHYKVFHESAAAMDGLVRRILDAKVADVAQGVPPPPRRRMAFLDHVLRSEEGANMSAAELNDELKTFLFAGSTTSMDYLSFVAVVLAMFPDVQRKVHQELDEIFGGPAAEGRGEDRAVAPSDLGHMHYLECVLKEVLRFAPPAPFFFRQATEDVVLPSGHLVPRGCLVALVPAGTHRDPRHFSEPLRFDPDRFLGERGRGRHPFAYIPFSAGPRNCVGQRYALMFAKAVMATLLRRYAFLPAPDGPRTLDQLHVDPGVTMSVRGGARVRVQRRGAGVAA